MVGGNRLSGRRPELDGVRGIAVLLVMAGHVGVPGLYQAGPAGVTLFFALSGFLISNLLIEEYARTGSIDLRRFYGRRARRLVPGLLVWTSVVTVVGVAIARPWFFSWGGLAASLGYVGNWVLATGGWLGAFNGTWSLAVEEQFYVVWPLLALLALRRNVRAFALASGAVLVASLLVRLVLVLQGAGVMEIYYRTDTTAVGLAAGALLAARAHLRPPPLRHSRLGGAGAVLVAAVALEPELTSTVLTLVAVVGSVMLLDASTTTRLPWLTSAPLRWFGRRSYGLYLWHIVPAWVLHDMVGLPWWETAVIVVPLSCLCAEASWRWVERPVLSRAVPRRDAARSRAAGQRVWRDSRTANTHQMVVATVSAANLPARPLVRSTQASAGKLVRKARPGTRRVRMLRG